MALSAAKGCRARAAESWSLVSTEDLHLNRANGGAIHTRGEDEEGEGKGKGVLFQTGSFEMRVRCLRKEAKQMAGCKNLEHRGEVRHGQRHLGGF